MPRWRRLSTPRRVSLLRVLHAENCSPSASARAWSAKLIARCTTATQFTKFSTKRFVCHVGFAVEGQPFVIPTMFARIGDNLYFHGSAASRMIRGLCSGLPVCITVTLTDGLVLARSVFNHSMNYRSVVALGQADPDRRSRREASGALQAFTEKLIPGRWNDARQPNEKELKATSILKLPLTEVSAKVRVGGVEDDARGLCPSRLGGNYSLRLVADARFVTIAATSHSNARYTSNFRR